MFSKTPSKVFEGVFCVLLLSKETMELCSIKYFDMTKEPVHISKLIKDYLTGLEMKSNKKLLKPKIKQMENAVNERIKAFEKRYLIEFKPTHKMCKKLGIQLRRIKAIMNNEIEPTIYEVMTIKKFLQLPSS